MCPGNARKERKPGQTEQYSGGVGKPIDKFLFSGIEFHNGHFIVKQPIIPDGSLWKKYPERSLLAFEDEGENDHPRLQFIDDVGILQAGVTAMDIFDPFADLEFRREDKY